MRRPSQKFSPSIIQRSWLGGILSLLLAGLALAQAVPYARTYQRSKEEVETALKDLQVYSGQKLPIVDGFVATGDKPLNQYERAFYQFSIDLLPGNAGGTIVRLTAKITAWYADKDPAKSGYQVLPSNGRLELDLLDRLEEKFGGKPVSSITRPISNSTITAPKPKIDLGGLPGGAIPAATNPLANPGDARNEELDSLRARREAEEKRMRELSAELQSLQEIQKNQAHPLNLVVVKKSGTPVLAKPAEGARVLFVAAAEDEFEFIEAQGEWIHVQISGASRGYIRRSSLELPEAFRAASAGSAPETGAKEPFRLVRKETASFPGSWQSLQGKTVRIFTVQPTKDGKESEPGRKLLYAKSLLLKSLDDLFPSAQEVSGVVLVFDSADGGMISATLASLQRWRTGALSDSDFWRECHLDPPESFPAGTAR